ncbi:unnamed protein product [Blepharisma stoltei]|uniref:Uncharacterized protein n=1 Tax=Blepharisma stoltei TaxID=1481888 RepID=A0AAU9JZ66_9CILI|nr:unnamed protein product [Blepharisma stoltei]
MKNKALTESFISSERIPHNSIKLQLLKTAYTHQNALRPHFEKIKKSRKLFQVQKEINIDGLFGKLKENLKVRVGIDSPVAITKLEAMKKRKENRGKKGFVSQSMDIPINTISSCSPSSPEHILKSRYNLEINNLRKRTISPVKVKISKKDIIIPVKVPSPFTLKEITPYELKEITIDDRAFTITEEQTKDLQHTDTFSANRECKSRASPGKLDTLMGTHKPQNSDFSLNGKLIPTTPLSTTRRTNSTSSTPKVAAISQRPLSQGNYPRKPNLRTYSAIDERITFRLSEEENSVSSTPFEPKETKILSSHKTSPELSVSSYASLIKLEDVDIKSIYCNTKSTHEFDKEIPIFNQTMPELTPEIEVPPVVKVQEEVHTEQFDRRLGGDTCLKEDLVPERLFSYPKIKVITILRPEKERKAFIRGSVCKGLTIRPTERKQPRCIHNIALSNC